MKKVVLIEDEKILSDLLTKRFDTAGYEVMLFENGNVTPEEIKKYQPDIILLDMMLPQRDGLEVLEELHEEGITSSIPVLIISNSGQDVEIEKAKQLGARDWLLKTEFDPQEVITKVNNILEK